MCANAKMHCDVDALVGRKLATGVIIVTELLYQSYIYICIYIYIRDGNVYLLIHLHLRILDA